MENFTSNSHKSKEQNAIEEKKRVEKVVTGKVKTVKKNKVHKFTDIFLAEDLASVGVFLWEDTVVPNVKRLLEELGVGAVRRLLYGKDGSANRDRGSGIPKISYRSYYESDKRDPRTPSRDEQRNAARFDYHDLVFETRGDAEIVLTLMDEMLDQFRVVTILDMYDAAGVTAPYTADKYGWKDLRDASVVPVRNGYVIKLPKAYQVD